VPLHAEVIKAIKPLLEGAGRSIRQGGDIKRAEETVAEYQRQQDDVNAQFQEET